MKKAIQCVLGRLGYVLHRKDSKALALDPYDVKQELIQSTAPIIFDVGAHVGVTAKYYRELFPNSIIHCFEPFPDSFQKLKEATVGDSRTTAHRIALSDKKGTATLNANALSATNSLLPTDEKGSFYWGKGYLETVDKCEVETTTIDSFCRDNNIPSIDILKLDVQGVEYSVITGAQEMLASQSISMVYTELIIASTYRGQRKFHEFLALLDSYGFELLDIYNSVRKSKQLIQVDCIFVSPRFKQSYEQTMS